MEHREYTTKRDATTIHEIEHQANFRAVISLQKTARVRISRNILNRTNISSPAELAAYALRHAHVESTRRSPYNLTRRQRASHRAKLAAYPNQHRLIELLEKGHALNDPEIGAFVVRLKGLAAQLPGTANDEKRWLRLVNATKEELHGFSATLLTKILKELT